MQVTTVSQRDSGRWGPRSEKPEAVFLERVGAGGWVGGWRLGLWALAWHCHFVEEGLWLHGLPSLML